MRFFGGIPRWTTGAALCLLLLFSSACDPVPTTELIVVVDSDMQPGAEITALEILTEDPAGAILSRRDVPLRSAASPDGATLPLSFGVVRDGDAARPLRLRVRAIGPTGTVIERLAIVPFVARETRRVVLLLARSCTAVVCSDVEQTCIAGTCSSAAISVADLEIVEPGRELAYDGGVAPIRNPCEGAPRCDPPVDVVLGRAHACALRRSGLVACWGENGEGQLGVGTAGPVDPPQTLDAVGPMSGLTAAGDTTCSFDDVDVVCWGSNASGQLGRGDGALPSSAEPAHIVVPGVRYVRAFEGGACAVTGSHAVTHCWGAPFPGSTLPAIDTCATGACVATPTPEPALVDALDVTIGSRHTCASFADDTVRCAGANELGQLGDGTTTSRDAFAPIPSVPAVRAIAIGDASTCVVEERYQADTADPEGVISTITVRCWGAHDVGQLGAGDVPGEPCGATPCSTTPVTVAVARAKRVFEADGAFCAHTEIGEVFCWGSDAGGQLGDGNGSPETCTARDGTIVGCSRTPVPVLTGIRSIHARDGDVCAVRHDGAVLCWGRSYGASPTQIALPPL